MVHAVQRGLEVRDARQRGRIAITAAIAGGLGEVIGVMRPPVRAEEHGVRGDERPAAGVRGATDPDCGGAVQRGVVGAEAVQRANNTSGSMFAA